MSEIDDKCSNCGSDDIITVEEFDEGEQRMKSYAECRKCGNAWETDGDNNEQHK